MLKYTLMAFVGLASAGSHHKTLSGVAKTTLVTPGHNSLNACDTHKSCHSCTANLCTWDSKGACSLGNKSGHKKHGGNGKGVEPYKISDWFAMAGKNQCQDTLNICAKPVASGNWT